MQTRLPVSAQDLGSYSDLNQLQELKAPSKRDQLDSIQKVAAQFESLFVNLIMKTMRQANQVLGEDNPLNSQQTRFYQGMYDQELAQKLSGQGGLGLQEVLVRQLSPQGSSASTARESVSPGALQQRLSERRLTVAERRPHSAAGDTPVSDSPATGAVQPLIAGLPVPQEAESGTARGAVRQLIDAVFEGIDGQAIAGPTAFVQKLMPFAREAAERIGVPPQYLLAQAALETGWGKHLIGGSGEQSSHNLFGIKAHRDWPGDTRTVTTHEYRQGIAIRQQAKFRAYPDWSASFNDYVDFLQQNPRYEKALASTEKPERFLNELQRAGYATDPRYADKIQRIAHSPEMQEALSRL